MASHSCVNHHPCNGTGNQGHACTFANDHKTYTHPDLTAAVTITGPTIGTSPAFVSGDKYLVVDTNGNIHVSALGPAS